uniref:Bicarbonate transporter-like transmembrane domain-containing protein n=1 Tax=Romanomermis culicivorax TaxID=13658 RepID=A0A915JTP2_ROMCU
MLQTTDNSRSSSSFKYTPVKIIVTDNEGANMEIVPHLGSKKVDHEQISVNGEDDGRNNHSRRKAKGEQDPLLILAPEVSKSISLLPNFLTALRNGDAHKEVCSEPRPTTFGARSSCPSVIDVHNMNRRRRESHRRRMFTLGGGRGQRLARAKSFVNRRELKYYYEHNSTSSSGSDSTESLASTSSNDPSGKSATEVTIVSCNQPLQEGQQNFRGAHLLHPRYHLRYTNDETASLGMGRNGTGGRPLGLPSTRNQSSASFRTICPLPSCPPTPNFLAVTAATAMAPFDRTPGSFYGSTDFLSCDTTGVLQAWGDETPPMNDRWSFCEEYENVTLMYAKHEKIPMKDFGSEIRATMDIDHLLNKAVLLLDLPETSLEEIFNKCMLPTVQHRHVAIARLCHPTNLGRTMQDLRFIIIVIAPSRAKGTKTALETARTFATLFTDIDIRQKLVVAQGVDQFRQIMLQSAKELAYEQNQWRERKFSIHLSDAREQLVGPNRWYFGRGLKDDLSRRLPHYISDYTDCIRGSKNLQKLFSTIVFLYFACLLPSIAFGVLNYDHTCGAFGVREAVYAQAIGGLFFSILGGQPMIILMTTVPISIYVKIIFDISKEAESINYQMGVEGRNHTHLFFGMYACVGLSAQFFVLLYACTELSNIMRFATRSTEEIFSLFMAVALVVEAGKALRKEFSTNYNSPFCGGTSNSTDGCPQSLDSKSKTGNVGPQDDGLCHRDRSILYILLMFGTLWFGMFLYNFRKMPYLTVRKREMLADYALPVSVLIASFMGASCFGHIKKVPTVDFSPTGPTSTISYVNLLTHREIFLCIGLGFCLSFLFFMDQNITSSIVNNQQNKLKKGSATHFDLASVAILNIGLSLSGLPWMYAALPQSPLHLRALADVEERISQGHVHESSSRRRITNVRETRLASIVAHFLIMISATFLIPTPLEYIPRSVLDGLLLYVAATSLNGNEMFERVLLLFTEQ